MTINVTKTDDTAEAFFVVVFKIQIMQAIIEKAHKAEYQNIDFLRATTEQELNNFGYLH